MQKIEQVVTSSKTLVVETASQKTSRQSVNIWLLGSLTEFFLDCIRFGDSISRSTIPGANVPKKAKKLH